MPLERSRSLGGPLRSRRPRSRPGRRSDRPPRMRPRRRRPRPGCRTRATGRADRRSARGLQPAPRRREAATPPSERSSAAGATCIARSCDLLRAATRRTFMRCPTRGDRPGGVPVARRAVDEDDGPTRSVVVAVDVYISAPFSVPTFTNGVHPPMRRYPPRIQSSAIEPHSSDPSSHAKWPVSSSASLLVGRCRCRYSALTGGTS